MRFALPRRPSVRSWFPSPGLHSARRGGRTDGADEEWTDAAGTVELKRRRRNGVQEEEGRTEGRREGRFIHSQLVVSCVSHAGKAATRGGIKSAAKESALGEGVLSYLCVYLESEQCQILNHSKMVKLTEEMIVARTRVSDMANVKKLNCW